MLKQLSRMMKRSSDSDLLDRVLEWTDKHLENFKTLVQPAPESKPRTPFSSGLPREKVSMLNLTAGQRLKTLTRVLPLLFNMQSGARMYDGKFQPTKREVSPQWIQNFEARAREAGVKDIKYVKVPHDAIFRDKAIPHEYAIVFTAEMDKEPIETAPSFECQYEVLRGYENLAIIGNKLARFIRRQGFAAYPGTALGGVTDYVYLAELAGLSAIGYHGLLITPGEGARLRISTIYMNISNLPLETENEHLWVRDFCSMCKKCVRACPVNAIYLQPKPHGDGGMQCIEHVTCRNYFTENYGCGVCLAVCPFSQVGYDKVKAHSKGNPNAPQFRILQEV